jgi:hypothetical protein
VDLGSSVKVGDILAEDSLAVACVAQSVVQHDLAIYETTILTVTLNSKLPTTLSIYTTNISSTNTTISHQLLPSTFLQVAQHALSYYFFTLTGLSHDNGSSSCWSSGSSCWRIVFWLKSS